MERVLNVAWIRLTKWFLILTIILGAGYILNFMLNNQRYSSAPQTQEPLQAGQVPGQETMEESRMSLEQISSVINQRDIFQAKAETAISSGQAAAAPTGELPANLKVVGILVGRPSQIIIEDATIRQTYFINEGETQGGIRLQRVDPDKFVINYLDQDIAININQAVKGEPSVVNPIINNVQIP
jgi:hypothetical protein